MVSLAKVAVEKATYSFDQPFDYLIPAELEQTVRPGCRVKVQFGAGSRNRQGIVLAVEPGEANSRLKPVLSCVDDRPILNGEGLALLEYLKTTTFCTYYEALRVLIPAGLGVHLQRCYQIAPDVDETAFDGQDRAILEYLRRKRQPVEEETLRQVFGLSSSAPFEALAGRGALLQSEALRQKVQDERLTMVRLCETPPQEDAPKLTAKQQAVVALLQEVGCASVKEVCYFAAVTRAVVDRVVACGAAEYYQQEVYRNPYAGAQPNPEKLVLSPAQQAVYEPLSRLVLQKQASASLLYGVTGSGKTQVFLKLIEAVVASGRQAIVMVPEISLTPQTLDKFHAQFGSRVAVLHSGLSLGERMDEYKRIRDGKADIVVGTRSAVFAPLPRLGLVVLDEEQEHTYKSEQSPRFHARDVAAFRCRYHGAALLLASATPSIESYYKAKKGEYHLFELKERFTGSKLPDVTILDMNDEPESAYTTGLSSVLTDELYLNLQQKEQSILLLNRRGYHTIVKCAECGEVVSCPHCSISLTYHSANNQLMCHYCGYHIPAASSCPKCGSRYVRYSGVGTQKVQEELERLFPDARILRMDMDTTMSKFSYDRSFRDFADGRYDIMVGTQMVAKGLDFPNVTLVGVLSADQSLYSDDFRSFERTFSLVTQVVGRCGRGELRGRAFIQTLTPENRVIDLASAQNYPAFYVEEIAARRLGLYPPFCHICLVGFTGQRQQQVRAAARWFAGQFARLAASEYAGLPLRVLGPSEGSVLRVAGKYRYKLLIKCRQNAATRELIARMLAAFYEEKENRGVTAFVDPCYDTGF